MVKYLLLWEAWQLKILIQQDMQEDGSKLHLWNVDLQDKVKKIVIVHR